MHVFLTGPTGYIGSAVLDAMIKGGHRVTALARDPEKAERLQAKGAATIIGELGLPKTYAEAVKPADAVVHAAKESSPRGVEKEMLALDTMIGALNEASRADGKPRVFIYTSGIWVLGRSVKSAEEDAPLDPPAYAEWRPAHEEKVLSASRGRSALSSSDPGIVYGGGRGIVADLIKDALNGLIRVVGPGKNRWPCIYDHDLAELYVKILESPTCRRGHSRHRRGG
jgi:nucleoside-diphosphate-sugar epimerase